MMLTAYRYIKVGPTSQHSPQLGTEGQTFPTLTTLQSVDILFLNEVILDRAKS